MEHLRKWRESLTPPTYQAAGALLGVSAAQVHRIENGQRRVGPHKVHEFSRVTGIPVEHLRPDIFSPEAAQ
jgi:DNA-binding transcriptional regulator YdaS (Cro superfamily)